MKENVVSVLKNALSEVGVSFDEKQIDDLIEIPPQVSMGDFAFPCFSLAKELKKSPQQIALDVRSYITKTPKGFSEVMTSGPYINFYLDKKKLAVNLINEVSEKGGAFGKVSKKQKTMIEFPSPNTNKPLHLGHLRNMSIGQSVSRILKFSGNEVVRANLTNDRGIHICQSMLGYQKWGDGQRPEDAGKKPDHFVGDYYVKFTQNSDEELEKEAQEMLKKWESGDKETYELWEIMRRWALKGHRETYNKFGIKVDKDYFESDIYSKGKELVEEGLEKGVFYKTENGSVAVDLSEEGLGEKILLRSDGTSVYMTQDLYLANLKFEEYDLDKSIYVVDYRQNYHFEALEAILRKLDKGSGGNIYHLSYGVLGLPEGKMSSRKGNVVGADDLIDEVQDLVRDSLKERGESENLEEKSLKIALASIKYMLLKVDSKKDTVFDPKESINFEGDTGPYMQYTYARASSILEKGGIPENWQVFDLEEKEIELLKKLYNFSEVVQKSYKKLDPSLVAHYSYELSQIFNEFYHECKVVGSEKEGFRLKLVEAFRQVLKNSLWLLGIEVMEKM
ncbi:MAG: arginine--tRNA ligase [Candidatus Pacearchaeota archaeon]